MTAEEVLEQWRDDDCGYIDVMTSGSTGTPKHLHLSKKIVLASALRTNSFFGVNAESLLYSLVSPDFIGGKMMAIRADVAGCESVFEVPSNRPAITSDRPVTLLAAVPSQMWHIVDHLEDYPPVHAVIIGGAAILEDLRRKIVASGMNAFETYGMTETASHIALRKVGEDCFSILPGIECSLDDRGCLSINSPETGLIQTNDLAVFYGEGRFRILGRADNIIITGAKKVIPEEIERIASSFFPDDEIAVSWLPDPLWGQKVVMVSTSELKKEDRRKFEAVLPPHKRPKEYITVDSIPRTPNGKISRPALAKKINSR